MWLPQGGPVLLTVLSQASSLHEEQRLLLLDVTHEGALLGADSAVHEQTSVMQQLCLASGTPVLAAQGSDSM